MEQRKILIRLNSSSNSEPWLPKGKKKRLLAHSLVLLTLPEPALTRKMILAFTARILFASTPGVLTARAYRVAMNLQRSCR